MDDPHDDEPTIELSAVPDDYGPSFDKVYFGALDQTQGLRFDLRAYLANYPMVDDVVLIASEFAANAILYSSSRNTFFICRAEVQNNHIRVEVEDLGGPWCRAVDNERPHGLDIVQMLSDEWGTEVRPCDGMRVTWARVPYRQNALSEVTP